MSLSIQIGNLLFRRAYFLYKPMYALFKKRQDAFEIQLLKKYVNSGATVIDIGANIGFYAEILSELVGPKGTVHCFEPDATNYSHLKNSCGNLKNVFLNHKAVGGKTETIRIYTSPLLNVDHRTYEPEHYESVIDVEAVALDEYVNQYALKPDLIKMDIQGFEMEALKGMLQTVSSDPDLVLVSEFWPYGLKKAGSSVSAYFQTLTQIGFRCYLLEHGKLTVLTQDKVSSIEHLPESSYFNMLATKKDV